MAAEVGIMNLIEDMVLDLFRKSTIVHEFYVHKNDMKLCFGIKLKKVFSAIVTVKSREKVTTVTFNLNGYKYKLYLATGKILTAIRVTLLYIKGRITKDGKLLRELNAVTLNRKEYKQMKLNKKKLLHAMEEESNKKKKSKVAGPLVIKLGYRGESEKFEEAAAW